MTKLELDAVNLDSKVSSMRIAFFYTIKVIVAISLASIIATIIFTYFDKVFPLAQVSILIGVLGTVAFGGKAAQSFSEKPMPALSSIVTSVATAFDKGIDPK